MIKMGIYGILRMYALLADTSLLFGQTVLVIGMVSGVLGVVYALGKHDIKRLLAYHSVENIGIILIGAGLGMIGVASGSPVMAAFGFAGSLLHVLNHSIFKSLLFMGAGAVLQKTRTRHVDELGGLGKRMPITGRTFLVGSVSISGLPPFNGFISEFLIYFAAFQGLTADGIVISLRQPGDYLAGGHRWAGGGLFYQGGRHCLPRRTEILRRRPGLRGKTVDDGPDGPSRRALPAHRDLAGTFCPAGFFRTSRYRGDCAD